MELSGYQIIEPIGRDDNSESYLAKQSDTGKRVVIKCWSKDGIESTETDATIRSFIREGEYASQISHPNIANICAVGETNDLIYCVTDYICGDSLESRASDMCLLDKIYVVKQLAGALDYLAEKSIITQSVLPSNILLTTDQSRPCLTRVWQYPNTFAVANEQEENEAENCSLHHYLSPEQLGHETVDIRSSLYNLGMVFYYLLAGKSKSIALAKAIGENKNAVENMVQLPSTLELFQGVVDKAVAIDPQQRFQSGKEFISSLELIRDEEIILADSAGQPREAVHGKAPSDRNEVSMGNNVIALPVVNRKRVSVKDESHELNPPAEQLETLVERNQMDQNTDNEESLQEQVEMETIGGALEDTLDEPVKIANAVEVLSEKDEDAASEVRPVFLSWSLSLAVAGLAFVLWLNSDAQRIDNLLNEISHHIQIGVELIKKVFYFL